LLTLFSPAACVLLVAPLPPPLALVHPHSSAHGLLLLLRFILAVSCLLQMSRLVRRALFVGAFLAFLEGGTSVAAAEPQVGSISLWQNPTCQGDPALSQTFIVGQCFINNGGGSNLVTSKIAQQLLSLRPHAASI
jgi:hypothetical protein